MGEQQDEEAHLNYYPDEEYGMGNAHVWLTGEPTERPQAKIYMDFEACLANAPPPAPAQVGAMEICGGKAHTTQ